MVEKTAYRYASPWQGSILWNRPSRLADILKLADAFNPVWWIVNRESPYTTQATLDQTVFFMGLRTELPLETFQQDFDTKGFGDPPPSTKNRMLTKQQSKPDVIPLSLSSMGYIPMQGKTI